MPRSSSVPPEQSQVEASSDAATQWESEDAELDFKPMTAEEAVKWRKTQPKFSVWELVGLQALLGFLAAVLAWFLMGRPEVAWSVAYGALSVVLPSAVMAYGVTSSSIARLLSGMAQAAFVGFLFWEGVKVLLVVLMLWVAPRVVSDLSWLGLLAGLVLVLKVHWLGLLLRQSYKHKR